MTARDVSRALAALGSADKAKQSMRFFKTGPGQYGEGDRFIGVTVPEQRKIARAFAALDAKELQMLLQSPLHEERLTGLFILVRQFEKARRDPERQTALYQLYLANLAHVNNWDLVDSSAPQIVGAYLMNRDRAPLYRWVKAKNLWLRRVAMVSTQAFIREGQADDTFALAEALLGDDEDLMHKATGWMLREVGKYVGLAQLRGFLKKHAAQMPRTALRYAIEHLPPDERKRWLAA